ncbi:hypothetical protein [Pontibacter sp. G13]|uniref:hypothetical protein n=1 Tax=Pontibacter sp. G13 TaxID=3074898 RepID=UPI00288A6C83|nr:hypothetical protein [Pontibacter sp. G13]WNJ17260.1 hypothetical protein RJD25_20585 [Pontibacter sp. G13]
MNLEHRPYYEGESPEVCREIQERMYLYRPQLIVWNEMPFTTLFQLQLFKAKLREITQTGGQYVMVVNLTKTHRAGSAYRAELVRFIKSNKGVITKYYLATGSIRIINICVELVAKVAGIYDAELHGTFEQALERAERHEAVALLK